MQVFHLYIYVYTRAADEYLCIVLPWQPYIVYLLLLPVVVSSLVKL